MTQKDQTPEDQAEDRAVVDSGDGAPENDAAPGTDITEVTSAVAARNQANMQTFMNWCVAKAETTDEDQFAIMASIMSEIMESDSPEELMRERSALHAKDILGRPLLMHGFEIREGDYEDSAIGFYAAITASAPGSDSTRVITCGGMKVLMKLFMLDGFNEWPQPFMFTGKETRKGYTALDIVRPEMMR